MISLPTRGVSADQPERIREAIEAQTARQYTAALEHATAAGSGSAPTVLSNWEQYSAAGASILQPYRSNGHPVDPVGTEVRHLAPQPA